MQKLSSYFEEILHRVITNINKEALIIGSITLLIILSIFTFNFCLNLFRTGKNKGINEENKQNKKLPALADHRDNACSGDQQPEPLPDLRAALAFVKELAACAQETGVPVAPLQTVLDCLIEAGIGEADILARLVTAAGELAALRKSLAEFRIDGAGLEEASLEQDDLSPKRDLALDSCSVVCPDAKSVPIFAGHAREALAGIDRGDFDAAIEALRRGREVGWTGPVETSRAEAELYAMEGVIDHLRRRFCDAAQKYGAAAALIFETRAQDGAAWPYLIGQARELCDDGRETGNRTSPLFAAEICHRSFGLLSRDRSPSEWTATKHCLSQALFMVGSRHIEPHHLGEAIEAYLGALDEWTRDHAPLDWAKAQTDLGDALQPLGGQAGDLEPLHSAAKAYHTALTAWCEETTPVERAGVYKSLGDTLADLGIEADQAERLIGAVNDYQEVQFGTSLSFAPAAREFSRNNLGNAFQPRGEKEEGSGGLGQAASAYLAAKQDGVAGPAGLAAGSSNLGKTLSGECANSTAKLKEAVSEYGAALEAQPADASLLDTARTQLNLAYTLAILWIRLGDPQGLDDAVIAVDSALQLIAEAGAGEQTPEVELACEPIPSEMDEGQAEMATA